MPFIQGTIPDQVVGSISATQGQTDVFQIPYVNPNGPGGSVAFTVQGGVDNPSSPSAFTPISADLTASVDANGIVTIVPKANLTLPKTYNVLVGVRNASATATSPSSYSYQNITLTINPGTEINLPPVATPASVSTSEATPVDVQLVGNTGNPASSQTLTFEIVTPPSHGTVTGFDAQTGKLTYTPNPGYQGVDTLQYRVTDVGNPTPNLTSAPATVTFNVAAGTTGAVRLINRVLVVTPPAKVGSVPNVINVTESNGNIQVTVNGQLDSAQPAATDLDQIVIYGSKTNDQITVDPSVTVPTNLNGGTGGLNTIKAGGARALINAWFGKNVITTGADVGSYVVGRSGHFVVHSQSNQDLAFAGTTRRPGTIHNMGEKLRGTFFMFQNGKPFKIHTPSPTAATNGTLARLGCAISARTGHEDHPLARVGPSS